MCSAEVTGNQVLAMALGRIPFTAHYAGGLQGRKIKQFCDTFDKPGAFHHFSVKNFIHEISSAVRNGVLDIACGVIGTPTQLIASINLPDAASA